VIIYLTFPAPETMLAWTAGIEAVLILILWALRPTGPKAVMA
jgi:hypothetical protein